MISITDDQLTTSSLPASPGLSPVLSGRVGHLIARAHIAMRQSAESALDQLGLGTEGMECTPRQVAALKVIAEEGPLSQQELGQGVGLDRTTVVAVVDFLEGRALVERRRNPRDRRAYALEVTADGRRWLELAWPVLLEAEREYLAPLAEDERSELTGLLQRLLRG